VTETSQLVDIKKAARRQAAARRAAAHETLKDVAGLALAMRGLPEGVSGRVVSGFMPYKSEITTMPLLNALRRQGWTTALPIVVAAEEPLIFRAWAPGEALVPGVWNIPIPGPAAPEVLPDVLLVPGLAFDRAGYRLGYGGGFYDRTLVKLRAIKPVAAVGVAYGAQLVDSVPRAAYDQPLDFIMTETETISCG
jgi:5-formyltetrahydrofolate cyclo-ligase